MKQSDLDTLIEELLKDPEFRKEWEKLCAEEMRKSGMSDNKSLCDTCLYRYSCEQSDAGISIANHLVCHGYAPVENEKGGTEDDKDSN